MDKIIKIFKCINSHIKEVRKLQILAREMYK
jgi:hypothetical protein